MHMHMNMNMHMHMHMRMLPHGHGHGHGRVIMPEHPAHLQQHDGYSRGGGACQVTLGVLERGMHAAHRHEERRGLPR